MKLSALSALSSHVAQCYWCLQEMTVHLDGPKSIMGTWWLNATVIRTQKISSALTGTRNMFLVAKQTEMVLCFTLWRVNAARYLVFPTLKVESWHALCAPSEAPREIKVINSNFINSQLLITPACLKTVKAVSKVWWAEHKVMLTINHVIASRWMLVSFFVYKSYN